MWNWCVPGANWPSGNVTQVTKQGSCTHWILILTFLSPLPYSNSYGFGAGVFASQILRNVSWFGFLPNKKNLGAGNFLGRWFWKQKKKKWLEWDREGGNSNKRLYYWDGCWAKAAPLYLDPWAIFSMPSRTAHAKGRKQEHFSIALARIGRECPGHINSLYFYRIACSFGQKDKTYTVYVWSGTISAWVWTYIYYMSTTAVAVIRSRLKGSNTEHQSLLPPTEFHLKKKFNPHRTPGDLILWSITLWQYPKKS